MLLLIALHWRFYLMGQFKFTKMYLTNIDELIVLQTMCYFGEQETVWNVYRVGTSSTLSINPAKNIHGQYHYKVAMCSFFWLVDIKGGIF